ncbi:hypothetical protein L249_8618 [Ophiocordyceps polyrhachis-furcata BCC 54312]|uniref:SEC63 domain-containing protein n=1 Tax=Ophiocordyceps polyrhachis-furcata BCC 54312 TaxID=1330021 RepID=A0A367L6S1_9HYPO|nr:hypothetical protein L249_8618 [Ophiocordyceps polyrhachis-furcata BCC 54312]
MATSSSAASNTSKNPPELHAIQLRHKVAAPTFRALTGITSSPDRREVLHRACQAIEFRSFPIRQTERAFFRHINDHLPIAYPLPATTTIAEPWHKAFLLVQVEVQRLGWPPKLSAEARRLLLQERPRIYQLLDRFLRCLVDVLGHRRHGRGIVVALDVLRSVKAGVWEGADNELLQVEGIGPAKMKRLVDAGVKSIRQLARLEFYHIERLLSRNPPFGHQLLHLVSGFPLLSLHFDPIGPYSPPAAPSRPNDNHQPLFIVRFVIGYDNEKEPSWNKSSWVTLVVESETGELLWFWRGSVKRIAGGKELIVGLGVRGAKIKVSLACEEIVGTLIRVEHDVP